jgi:hypothetical protein
MVRRLASRKALAMCLYPSRCGGFDPEGANARTVLQEARGAERY